MDDAARGRTRVPHARGPHLWIPRFGYAAAAAHMLVGVIAAHPHWNGIVS